MDISNLGSYICVDVETAGPNPSQYSLLTIGACTLGKNQRTFYVELRPVNNNMTKEAYATHRLSLKRLAERGLPPIEAMARFEEWLKAESPPDFEPVFLAYNTAFDWMFVNDYFYRHLNRNPFGHTALDIRSFYMGLTDTTWSETSMDHIRARYLGNRQFTHHALRDAMDLAEIFIKMLIEAKRV